MRQLNAPLTNRATSMCTRWKPRPVWYISQLPCRDCCCVTCVAQNLPFWFHILRKIVTFRQCFDTVHGSVKRNASISHKSWLTPTDRATRCVTPSRHRVIHKAGCWVWSTSDGRRSTVECWQHLATIDVPSRNYS